MLCKCRSANTSMVTGIPLEWSCYKDNFLLTCNCFDNETHFTQGTKSKFWYGISLICMRSFISIKEDIRYMNFLVIIRVKEKWWNVLNGGHFLNRPSSYMNIPLFYILNDIYSLWVVPPLLSIFLLFISARLCEEDTSTMKPAYGRCRKTHARPTLHGH